MKQSAFLWCLVMLLAAPLSIEAQNLEPGLHALPLTGPNEDSRNVTFRKRANERVVEIRRADLMSVPMEYLVIPTAPVAVKYVELDRDEKASPESIKFLMGISAKVTAPLSSRAEFLDDFLERVPCRHPVTGKVVPFKEYVAFFIEDRGYIDEGYFGEDEVELDPAGVLLRLFLFDSSVFLEADLMRDDGGDWYSLKDVAEQNIDAKYAKLALEAYRDSQEHQGAAAAAPIYRIDRKIRSHKESLTCILNTCLYLAEANRPYMQRAATTRAGIEAIRRAMIAVKILARHREPIRVVIVDQFTDDESRGESRAAVGRRRSACNLAAPRNRYMSMRPLIYPLSDLEPIRRAVGSRDEALLDGMVDECAKHHGAGPGSSKIEEFRDLARSFVEGKLRDEREPGAWEECTHHAARRLGLLQGEYPINEDWKWMAWSDYHDEISPQLSEDSRRLLHWLVEGRPLKAGAIDADGCYFAWLDPDEVPRLREALNALQVSEETLGELYEFHEELLEWLEECRGKFLLLIA